MPDPFKGLYAGSPVYNKRETGISMLKKSGFNTLILRSLHVSPYGDLNLNGEFLLVSNEYYVGKETHPLFAADLKALKEAPSSIQRIELSIGAGDPESFENIRNLAGHKDIGPYSTLYQNFKALRNSLPHIDAINLNDETSYDANSSIKFAVMLGELGYQVTLSPYTLAGYWTALASHINNARSGVVDAVYLKCFAGGTGNEPCQGWTFQNLPVYPGLSCRTGDGCSEGETPEGIFERFSHWKEACNIEGGWLSLFDDMLKCTGASLYADALAMALK